MAERFILDPAAVASGRTELDITPWVNMNGLDWGDASVQSYYSEAQRGDIPVDYRVPNREISGGLVFAETQGGTTTIQARSKIQAKMSLFQREGGWIGRVTNSGGTVYADVVDAQFRATSVSGWESRAEADVNASFSLSCIPDFYGEEQTLSDHSETSAAELIFTETDIEGDFPGRVRIVVDEDDAEDQRGLIGCFRSRHYSSDSTAAMEYEAEELGPLDTATAVAGTSIYGTATSGMWSGGTIVHHGTLSTSWTPVLETDIGGTTALDHTGTYQVFARLASTSGTTVGARFVYDVGDLVNPVENPEWRFPSGGTAGATAPFIADLGEIRLDAPPVGTHRWQGQVQMRGDAGAETGSVDKLWIVNKDEGMWRLSAPLGRAVTSFSTFIARSEFTSESGAINGDSDALGLTWASAGDATDVSVGSGVATRSEVSDANTQTGRYVASGVSALAAQTVKISFKWSALASASGSVRSGALARYTNTSNWFYGGVQFTYISAGVYATTLQVIKCVGGTVTTIWSDVLPTPGLDTYYTALLSVDTGGAWEAQLLGSSGGAILTSSGQDTDLATGGTLATGKPGFYDANTSATALTRTYDNFAAQAFAPDAVAYASESVQLTTDGVYREDSDGVTYGPITPIGDLPRIPVAGLEDRTTEVFLKASRGDLDQLPDAAIDDISARIYYRPSWLFVDS